jgi:probable F420-dependent oxidoreductase
MKATKATNAMKVDGGVGGDLARVGAAAQRAESQGYDGVWTAETGHDPFLPLLLAAEHTEHLELGTGIVVAFGRNPMTLATVSNDLQAYSKGRLLLGVGSQIKAHIEKRYSMPWSHPAPRMREFILAMRAIWDAWHSGTKLDFRGEFYTHTLMTPFFSPGPNPYGPPKVFLAAVGELMTEVAGEVADGILLHGFTTERYLREKTMPALERGMAKSGRKREDFELSYPAFIVTGATEEEMANAASGVRQQIAFYGSTPAYRGVLELHGWGDLQTELNGLSKQGKWVEMGHLITDDILDTFAVVCAPEDVPKAVLARYGDLVDRLTFYTPYDISPDRLAELMAGFKQS